MSPSPEANEQRYAQLERLYSARQWADLEASIQAWLQELAQPAPSTSEPEKDEAAEQQAIWRPRLWLILGHTRLYGFQDREGAVHLYEQVLVSEISPANGASDPNAIWREIAAASLSERQQSKTSEIPTISTDAMPWIGQRDGVLARASEAGQAAEQPQNPSPQPEASVISRKQVELSDSEVAKLAQGLLRVVI